MFTTTDSIWERTATGFRQTVKRGDSVTQAIEWSTLQATQLAYWIAQQSDEVSGKIDCEVKDAKGS